jgi:hypothetical protein
VRRIGSVVPAVLVLGALAAPGSAGAVYKPVVQLAFDTYAPAAAPAVTAVVTQASGEDTTRTIAARFPPGFTLNPGLAVTGCPAPAVASGSCPETSRVGSASVQTPYGPGSGGIYLTDDFRLFAHMIGLGGLAEVRVLGAIRALDDGSAEITFDGLPRTPILESRLALDGGARGIFLNPRRCGRYEAGARFVSHAGEQVAAVLPLEITGCAPVPRITSVRVSPQRIQARRRAVLSWRLDRAASVTDVTLFRLAGTSWRQLGTASAPAAAGTNRLVIGRRFSGRVLRAGTYRLVLRARAGDGAVSRARAARMVVAG